MTLYPFKQKTYFLPFSSDEALTILQSVTKKPVATSRHEQRDTLDDLYKFYGNIREHSFRIFRKVHYPENFSPLIIGEVHDEEDGCMITVRYKLFFGTIFLLLLISAICLFIGVFFIFYSDDKLPGTIALSMLLVNYFIVLSNFSIQFKKSEETLCEVFMI